MPCVDTKPGTVADTFAGFERLRYYPRQLLTADDMRIEQEYFRDKLRRHNRFLHGWGVVCGLEVKAAPAAGPLAVRICPGYALGPCGDEIYLADSSPYDLSQCVRRPPDPCTPAVEVAPVNVNHPAALVISIRYAECRTRPLRTLPAGCGCDDSGCEYSRIRDGFELRCRRKIDKPAPPVTPSICEIEANKKFNVPPCPPAPDDPWIDLAEITLNTQLGVSSIDDKSINNGIRRLVYSSAMIQEQLINCCCE